MSALGAAPVARDRSATEKVVAVTEALQHEHRLSEIARHAELPTSTVHRILQQLATLGWVRAGEDRSYRIGARLLALVSRAGEESNLVHAARETLLTLCERTGHTVHFAVRQGDEAVYVDKLDGRSAYQMRSRVGLAISLHSTAIGKSILARLPDAEVRSLATRTGLPAKTDRTITDATVLLAHLALVRRHGFAVDDEENEVHVRCIGAAVVDHRGLPVGGLSISTLAFELDVDQVRRLAPLVVAAAREVSSALGAQV